MISDDQRTVEHCTFDRLLQSMPRVRRNLRRRTRISSARFSPINSIAAWLSGSTVASCSSARRLSSPASSNRSRSGRSRNVQAEHRQEMLGRHIRIERAGCDTPFRPAQDRRTASRNAFLSSVPPIMRKAPGRISAPDGSPAVGPDGIRPTEIVEGLQGDAVVHLREIAAARHGPARQLSGSTVHADTPMGAYEQLAMMMQQAGMSAGFSKQDLMSYIQMVTPIVIQLRREGGKRGVSEIFFARDEP